MKVDKVTLEILANHMRAAAESMAYTLYRTAHSTFVKETEDFTIQILDAAGRTAAVPMDLGATWYPGLDYGRAIPMISRYGRASRSPTSYSGYRHARRISCCGNPSTTAAGLPPPATSTTPTWRRRQPPACRRNPSGRDPLASKLYRASVLNQELLDVMMTNVRKPDLNVGDLKAFVGAMNTGERKVRELIAKFVADTLRQGMSDLLDYAEHQARESLRSIPDGEYFFSDYADEDGPDG